MKYDANELLTILRIFDSTMSIDISSWTKINLVLATLAFTVIIIYKIIQHILPLLEVWNNIESKRRTISILKSDITYWRLFGRELIWYAVECFIVPISLWLCTINIFNLTLYMEIYLKQKDINYLGVYLCAIVLILFLIKMFISKYERLYNKIKVLLILLAAGYLVEIYFLFNYNKKILYGCLVVHMSIVLIYIFTAYFKENNFSRYITYPKVVIWTKGIILSLLIINVFSSNEGYNTYILALLWIIITSVELVDIHVHCEKLYEHIHIKTLEDECCAIKVKLCNGTKIEFILVDGSKNLLDIHEILYMEYQIKQWRKITKNNILVSYLDETECEKYAGYSWLKENWLYVWSYNEKVKYVKMINADRIKRIETV